MILWFLSGLFYFQFGIVSEAVVNDQAFSQPLLTLTVTCIYILWRFVLEKNINNLFLERGEKRSCGSSNRSCVKVEIFR